MSLLPLQCSNLQFELRVFADGLGIPIQLWRRPVVIGGFKVRLREDHFLCQPAHVDVSAKLGDCITGASEAQ